MTEMKPRRPVPAGSSRRDDPVYDKARAVASDGDTAARRTLAAREDVPPEVLYFLAEDPEPEVRRAIAGNFATPRQADLILASDLDEEVRYDLAGKISRLVPGLTEEAQARLHDLTLDVLEILARDELPRIRAILAEALAEVTGAPPPEVTRIVKRLARDEALEVAAPVLEHSVLLTDEDLLEIISGDPAAGALAAVARRSSVGEAISEVIAAGEDREAIADLLANPSAQIREETLDGIVDRASDIADWHAPLVRRPILSPRAARRIAGFVADALLDILRTREDLDAKTTAAVKKAVRRRLDAAASEASRQKKKEAKEEKRKRSKKAKKAKQAKKKQDAEEKEESPIDKARRLHAAGELDEKVIARAVSTGDRRLVNAALAVLADLSVDIVGDMVSSESAKAVTSVAWKAGLGMRFAVELQMRHAGIRPQSVLYARNGFDYPLSEDDMTWQIEFFGG